ncbi:hypothetical protein B0H12DRAFT_1242771 [Mycena haematopus]|nr:hypothetical protein B0H12DRAFT_1242771 [Mycena haematopus]
MNTDARIKDSRAALALQGKRDRWKAASARYYERHPEVKEKKRVKAAELRAAKKLARRRWDPPKKKQNDTPDPEPEEVNVSCHLISSEVPALSSPVGENQRADIGDSPMDSQARCAPHQPSEVLDKWVDLAPQYTSR